MPYINKVTLPTGSTYNIEGSLLQVKGTQASATANWTGTTTLEALKDGTTIAYYLPVASAANVTLNLTLADGTTTGAKQVYFGDTRMGTQFPAKSTIILTYDETNSKWYSNTYEGASYTFTSGSGSDASFEVNGTTVTVADVQKTAPAASEDKLITSGAVAKGISDAIDALPTPMSFKGTVGNSAQNPTILWSNLPAASASNEGYTYKVVTAHNTAPICIVGDTIVSNGTEWVVIPSGDDPGTTDTWRNIIVNGSEVLGVAINTGSLGFVDGENSEITWDSTNQEISVDVPKTTTYLSATADGVTINAPTGSAVTALPSTNTTDTFVKSYPGATSKLSTTSVTGVQSTTTTASKATAGTAVNVATTGTAATVASGSLGTETSTRTADTPMWGATVTNETLSFTYKPLSTTSVVPAVANGTITPYTFTDVTVPIKAASATTVATGSVSGSASGATIMTGLGTPTTSDAITALGMPTTSTFVTSATVSTQPNVTITSGATGDVEVVQDIGSTS